MNLFSKFVVLLGLLILGIIVFLHTKTPQEGMISGIVVPHHDVVKDVRGALFEKVAGMIEQPHTIVLISPNHFDVGEGGIQISDATWSTVFGDIQPNKDVINEITNTTLVSYEPESFGGEHGVTSLLSDIKNYFPNTQIVPILVKRDIPEHRLRALNNELKQSCGDCLMIASVDFSHDQPALLADLHDVVSIRALQNLDVDSLLSKVEVDSPESLALLVLWAQTNKTNKFELFDHTNPGFLSLDEDLRTTTHVFGIYTTGERVAPKPSATFIIGGDVMFGRGIAKQFGNNLADSLSLLGDRVFWGTDASIVNFEGAISTDSFDPNQDDVDGYPIFLFDPTSATVLRDAGVTMVGLANNHADNGGMKGVGDTHEILNANDIQWFGGHDKDSVESVGKFEGEGINVTIIGVNTFSGVPDITYQIETLRSKGERVIVFAHWGDEFSVRHNNQQELMAHDWIDAGADLVVGSHPHVVQDVDIYKGRPIVYSLGNFLFDQQFPEGTQQGMLLAGEFTLDGLTLFALPTASDNFKPHLLVGEEKQKRLKDFYEPWGSYVAEQPVGAAFFFPNL